MAEAQARARFDLPPQPLADSLRAVGSQTNVNVLFDPPLVAGHQAPALKGEYTSSQAFTLLLVGTGITYELMNEHTVVLAESTGMSGSASPGAAAGKPPRSGKNERAEGFGDRLQVAQVDQRDNANPSASGQGADEKKPTLEEIVVTAQKREESVQSVPLAITVLASEQLQRQGVQTIADLSRMSSSLEFTAQGASPGGGAFVRGIGTASNSLTKNATGSVSIVLDGVVLGNASISDIFDIDRIEILRGPQGTLFGSSVSAGVISVITKAPDLRDASVNVAAEYASGDLGSEYQRSSLRTAVNLPINDISGLRVALHSDENSGLFHNVYQDASSSDRSTGARARYLLAPSDDLAINLIADYNRAENDGMAMPPSTYRYAPPGSPLAASLAACGVTPSDSNFESCSESRNTSTQTDRGVSAQIDWSVLDDATITSISSWRQADTVQLGDILAIPFSIVTNCTAPNCLPLFRILSGRPGDLQTQKRTQYSQELRLTSSSNKHVEWVAGLYYQHYKLDDDSPGFLTFNTPVGPVSANTPIYANVSSSEYAGFGNVTWYLNDATRLIAGVRYTHSEISEDRIDPFATGNQNVYSLSTSNSKPSWRVGTQHDFNADTMAYVTVSTGYKSALISDNLQNGSQMFVVAPELPINYEIGIKKSLLENRLAVNADIFYQEVKDYQGQYCSPTNQGTILCLPSSVSSVITKGIELDVFGRPVKGLIVNLSGIYNPAKFPGGFQGSDRSDLGGKQLYYASKTKVTLSAEQSLPLTDRYSFIIGADYTYRSEQLQYTSALPQYIAPATNVFNARLGVTTDSWSLYIFGRNLGNEEVTRQISATGHQQGGLTQVFDTSSRRLVGLQLEAKL